MLQNAHELVVELSRRAGVSESLMVETLLLFALHYALTHGTDKILDELGIPVEAGQWRKGDEDGV